MRVQNPSGGKPIYICCFCGMSSLLPDCPEMTAAGDAVICAPCVRLAMDLFDKSTPEARSMTTVQNLDTFTECQLQPPDSRPLAITDTPDGGVCIRIGDERAVNLSAEEVKLLAIRLSRKVVA